MRNYKMKGRKLLGVLLAAALVLGLFPAAAMASETDAAAEIPAASETVNADETAKTAETPVTAGEVGTAEDPANEAAAGTAGASEEGGPSEESSATETSGAAEAAVSGEVPASEAEVQTTAIDIPAALAQAEVQTAAVLDIPAAAKTVVTEETESSKMPSLAGVKSVSKSVAADDVVIEGGNNSFKATVRTDALVVYISPGFVLEDVGDGTALTAKINGNSVKLSKDGELYTAGPRMSHQYPTRKNPESFKYEIYANDVLIGTLNVQLLPKTTPIDTISVSGLVSPVAGSAPVHNLSGGEGYDVSYVSWYKLADGAKLPGGNTLGAEFTAGVKQLTPGETFEEDACYTAHITLNIKDGYGINLLKHGNAELGREKDFYQLLDSTGAKIENVYTYVQAYYGGPVYSFWALFVTPAAAPAPEPDGDDESAEYTVRFVDWDGTLLNEQTVVHGEDAEAPENPVRTGYTFAGWDGALINVTGDLTLTARYTPVTPAPESDGADEPAEYTVRFVDWDGTLLNEQTVVHGEDAEAPENPVRTGYTFAGWDGALTDVTGDLTLTARYTPVTPAPEPDGDDESAEYTVRFVDWDGTLLNEQTVVHGEDAEAPENPVRTGYTFAGWDGALINVTGDLTLTARYTPVTPNLEPDGGDEPAAPGPGAEVTPFTPAVTPPIAVTPAAPAQALLGGEPAPLAAAPLAESLPDTNVPLAELPARTETIEEAATPLAAPLTGSWALVNLLLAVLTGLIIAARAARRVFAGRSGEERSERRGGRNVALILGAVLAAAAAAVFALTEDMSNPVALTDGFTLFMALIAAAQIALALIGGRNNREDAGVRA